MCRFQDTYSEKGRVKMLDDQLQTPVLLIVYKRPETSRRVFESIRKAKPKQLFIAANAPKTSNADELANIAEVRAIVEAVDWDCEVQRLYRNVHLDAKTSISSAIDWFFENVEEGIVLEDDCLPHPSFFRFCEELLARYRHDDRIMMISGDNFYNGKRSYSYYFSHYVHIWGWASWRRAWKFYDVNMQAWPEIKQMNLLSGIFRTGQEAGYWEKIFDLVASGKINTWDYQWSLTCFINNFVTILPSINLVSNIGFGNEATNTRDSEDQRGDMEAQEMQFPLCHPPYVIRDADAENYTYTNLLMKPLSARIINRIRSLCFG